MAGLPFHHLAVLITYISVIFIVFIENQTCFKLFFFFTFYLIYYQFLSGPLQKIVNQTCMWFTRSTLSGLNLWDMNSLSNRYSGENQLNYSIFTCRSIILCHLQSEYSSSFGSWDVWPPSFLKTILQHLWQPAKQHLLNSKHWKIYLEILPFNFPLIGYS